MSRGRKSIEFSQKAIKDFEIDPELNSIIEALWKEGYNTRSSCTGGSKHPSHFGYILLDRPNNYPLTSKQAAEVGRLVRRFTEIPFKVFKRGAIIFEGSVGEPYILEELTKEERLIPEYYPDRLWWSYFGGQSSSFWSDEEVEEDEVLEG